MDNLQKLLQEIIDIPDEQVTTLLNVLHQLKAKEQKRAQQEQTGLARQKFNSYAGCISLGYPTGIDNQDIDADLAKVYANES